MTNKLWIAAVVLTAVSGCKTSGPKQSDLSSLTNFQKDTGPVVCSGDVKAPGFSERYEAWWSKSRVGGPAFLQVNTDKTDYKPLIEPVLAAVPLSLQEWFFKNGGMVHIYRTSSHDSCSTNAIELLDHEGIAAGCVSTKDNGFPNIYVRVSDKAEEHAGRLSNIVQGFAIVFSFFATEFSDNYRIDSNGQAVLGIDQNAEFKTPKIELAFMMVDDLVNAMKQAKEVEVPNAYLSMVTDPSIFNPEVPRDQRWLKFWNSQNDPKMKSFHNFMFAQLIDSTMCSDETRKLVFGDGALFSQTGAFYDNKYRDHVNSVFAVPNDGEVKSLAAQKPAASNAESLGLVNQAPTLNASVALNGTFLFPRVRRVLLAPFAVANYFVRERPVATFFAQHRPVRRVLGAAVRTVAGGVRAVFPGTRCWRLRRRLC
jgi:hypothetical protein